MSAELIAKNPLIQEKLHNVLVCLTKDVFTASLQTHKLHGNLKNSYACRITHDLRIVFQFDKEKVILIVVGSHDEIY